MVIHVIGTVNGQVNEGMRNIATHLAKEFEKENTVLYSGLKQIPQIVLNSRRADVTMIFPAYRCCARVDDCGECVYN